MLQSQICLLFPSKTYNQIILLGFKCFVNFFSVANIVKHIKQNSIFIFHIKLTVIYAYLLLCTEGKIGVFDFCKKPNYIARIMLQSHVIDICNNKFARYCHFFTLNENPISILMKFSENTICIYISI